MKHRFMIWIAAWAVLVCVLLPQGAYAYPQGGLNQVDTSWFNYLEPRTTYTISTEAQLRGLASLVNEEQYLWKTNRTESFEGVTFVLSRDIALKGKWIPIGTDNQITFSGTFDGRGHTISGLDVDTDDPYGGFFGYLSGNVKDLTLEGSMKSTGNYCGSIAGYVSGTGFIEGCSANVQVSGRYDVGGIAGYNRGGRIKGCINYGEVIGASMVGGITGECRGGSVISCGNRGLLVSNGAGSFNNGTGGIAGRSIAASRLSLCYNTGDMVSSNEATGGVCGYTNSTGSSIENCYSIGSMRIESAQVETTVTIDSIATEERPTEALSGRRLPVYAGGIAGYVGSLNLTIANCYHAGQISGADFTGGIIGHCQNEMYSSAPVEFHNNYYAKGAYDGAIASDREGHPLRIRGAASEVYDSAFGHMAANLGEAYRDDKAGAYGSQGYPVLTWQQELQTEENLAVLDHIDPAVVSRLHELSLAGSEEEPEAGAAWLELFTQDGVHRSIPDRNNPLYRTEAK